MKSTIYFGGDIITLEDKLYEEAVLVEDGIIKDVGDYDKIIKKRKQDTELFDLKGNTLIPAFIDSHGHITAYSSSMNFVNLSDAKNFDEILKKLKNHFYDSNLKENDWLIGFGYDNNNLEEKKHPDKIILDNLNLKNPVIITHASGHMGIVNSKALKILKIDNNIKDPKGGKIGRIEGTDEPNGYLEESAFMKLTSLIPTDNIEKRINMINKAQKSYAGYGITTVQDGLINKNELELLKKSNLELDVIGYIDINKSSELIEKNLDYVKKYNNNFKVLGYKLILDGSPQGKTAWLTKPYKNTNDYFGYPVYDDDTVISFIEKSIKENLQLLVHCNGDAACDQLIRCYKKAKENIKSANDIRLVMIHAQLLRKDQLNDVKSLNIIPSFFIAHVYYWGDVHIKNFGERAYSISPAGSSEKFDIKFTLHQDTPVILPNMLETIWCAVNRVTKNGITIGESEKITPLEALKAITINAAYQYFEENKKGSIKAGKEANFTILSENILKIKKEDIKNIKIIKTIKRNKEIYSLND